MLYQATAFCALSFSIAFGATTTINVKVCNQGRFPRWVLDRAEREAAWAYRSIDVQVFWNDCEKDSAPQMPALQTVRGARSFTIRLRNDAAPPRTGGPASLDIMGRAYISAEGDGYLADAYYRAIQSMAESTTGASDAPALLGYVMVHEIGHLLLGPGHVPVGIMRPVWKTQDLDSVRKRWLTFTTGQSAQIRRALGAKK